jgi:hypothetical protein
MRLEIYGASDDLVEIEGDIREEFNVYDEPEGHLAISDGTLLSVLYDEHGFWRINRLVQGSAKYSKTEGTDIDSDYSDRVTLDGPSFEWVVYGNAVAKRKKKKEE